MKKATVGVLLMMVAVAAAVVGFEYPCTYVDSSGDFFDFSYLSTCTYVSPLIFLVFRDEIGVKR